MANEILVLEREPRGNGKEFYRLLFFFALPAPIEVNGQVIVETPSDTLPALALDKALVPLPIRDALDAGLGVFRVDGVPRLAGETNAQVLTKAQARWRSMEPDVIAELQAKYEYTGVWISV